MPDDQLRMVLPSTHTDLEEAVKRVQGFVQCLELDDELAYTVTLLASEAITNGMDHGNAWDASLTVDVQISATDKLIECVVTDRGRGFEFNTVDNPLESDGLLRSHGRGLYLMRTMADEFHIEGGGTQVRLRLYRTDSN